MMKFENLKWKRTSESNNVKWKQTKQRIDNAKYYELLCNYCILFVCAFSAIRSKSIPRIFLHSFYLFRFVPFRSHEIHMFKAFNGNGNETTASKTTIRSICVLFHQNFSQNCSCLTIIIIMLYI